MPSNDSAFLHLAEAVADGSSIDWDRAEASACDETERTAIQQLRRLASLGDAARSQDQTWGPLTLRGAIGSGSFGSVYRAWDTRLERDVALKLLTEDASAQPLASKVITEGRLLAQIRHPNIVTVHGADVFEGRAGVWMELVSGHTLKDIVQSQGPYGAHEAAIIGLDLCRALAAVHQKGFVHRDVKAQNVMREAGGRTVLMDFGATESTSVAALGGTLRGTPVYLSPEVLEGAPASTQSDLYSLGVLLFFLVSGEFPVVGSSLADFRERHARGDRKLLRDARPDLPRAFVRAIDVATAAAPGERPASAGAMEALLEEALVSRPAPPTDDAGGIARSGSSLAPRRPTARMALAVAALLTTVVSAGVGWRMLSERNAGANVPPVTRNSVLVLPFTNLSNDPENEYFSKGVTDDIVAHLARLGSLRVISGASVGRRLQQGKSARELGAELGVAVVMDGSVRRLGERVRIVSQLVDTQTGEQLWSDTFDRELEDIFQLQAEVARKIAVALRGELSSADAARLGTKTPQDFEAFNLYLKGRYHWSFRSEDGFQRSLQYYEQALLHDSQYAPAYAGMADTYSLMGAYAMMAAAEALSRAGAAATRAIELDPSLAEAHASLGYVQKNRFEWEAAEASLRQALALKPGYAQAHHWYSILLSQHGRFTEAIEESKTAILHDPLSMSTHAQLGTVLLLARRYDEAIQQYEKILGMDPLFASAHQIIGESYAYKGEYERALNSYQSAAKVGALGREDHEQLADRGFALARAGRSREAQRVLGELLERHRRNPKGVAANIATIYVALGQSEPAFMWLAKAVELRDPEIGYLKVDPRWDALRTDRRFADLLRQVGFSG